LRTSLPIIKRFIQEDAESCLVLWPRTKTK
jgi:hypothetical protein